MTQGGRARGSTCGLYQGRRENGNNPCLASFAPALATIGRFGHWKLLSAPHKLAGTARGVSCRMLHLLRP